MGLESLNSIGAYSTTGNIYEKTTQNPYVIDEKSTIIVRDSETGKTYKMTYREYIQFIQARFIEANSQGKKNSYELGSEKNGVRIVDVDNVAVIVDENNKVVCFGICFPSLAKAIQGTKTYCLC